MAKDLGLAANALRAGGIDAELGLKAAELYARFAEGAGADQDFSGIVRAIRAASSQTTETQEGTPA